MISMNSEITKKTGRIRYSTGFGRFGIHVDLKNWVGVPEKEEKNKKQNRVTERWNKAKEDQVRNKRRLDYDDDDDDDDASSTSGRRRTRFSAFIPFNCFRGRMDEKIRLGK
ncbi:hypothetical protein RUM44_005618 [Polyplax serrata]|uniref:Uncharacterized protein n=1 Tax=Polyplax serrata TaxID=468196 RepID=A0ABR1AFG6_POLSC